MAIFAIADLHLSHNQDKPMDVFGRRWNEHQERLEENWRREVSDEDTVLIPGDISWAMQLDEALPDIRFTDSLPGRKIIMKGNHDYWWETVTKMKKAFAAADITSIDILHNDAFQIGGCAVYGTRGWITKDSPEFTAHDLKIYERELQRARLSISAVNGSVSFRIMMLHYPPFSLNDTETEFTRLCDENDIDVCIFGHIHSEANSDKYDRMIDNTRYKLVSADHLQFKPYKILNNL